MTVFFENFTRSVMLNINTRNTNYTTLLKGVPLHLNHAWLILYETQKKISSIVQYN